MTSRADSPFATSHAPGAKAVGRQREKQVLLDRELVERLLRMLDETEHLSARDELDRAALQKALR